MGWFHAAYAAGELDLDGGDGGGMTCALPQKKKVQIPPCPKSLTGIEVIYHMCEKADWEESVADKIAYFPPTFHKDGKFTRASVFKEGLVDVANHFYKASSDRQVEWICLEINLKLLLDMGIVVLPQPEEEEEKDTTTSTATSTTTTASSSSEEDGKEEKNDTPEPQPVQCFQVYSGISTIIPGLVTNIYPVRRGGCGTFLALENPVPYKTLREKQQQQQKQKRQLDKARQDNQAVNNNINNIPGVGSVPGAKATMAKPEQSADTKTTPKSSSSFKKMFGMGSKK